VGTGRVRWSFSERALEGRDELAGGRKTLGEDRVQCLVEPKSEALGEVRANGPRIWELTTSDLGEDHGETVLYLPDGGSSQALIDDAPEGPKVSAIVDLSL